MCFTYAGGRAVGTEATEAGGSGRGASAGRKVLQTRVVRNGAPGGNGAPAVNFAPVFGGPGGPDTPGVHTCLS